MNTPETQPSARERLRSGLIQFAVKRGDFVLASGQKSNIYVDVRAVSLRGTYLRLIGELLWERIRPAGAQAVGGLTLGADPIVAAVTIAAADQGVDCPALIVRKSSKEHGTGRRVEGPMVSGMRVAVVEDVATTGGSAQTAADAIIACGGTVIGVYAVLDRHAGASELFAARGWRFESLFSLSDIGV